MDLQIRLDSFDKIKKFINITSVLAYEIDLISDKYVVDGKSIMGVLSLDLSKAVTVRTIGTDRYPKELEEFIL